MMQTAALVLIIIGLFPKFAAFFVTMPDPVIGGLFCIMFGLVAGVGIANLKYCDLSSSRNIFIFGFSLFAGMAVPHWVTNTDNAINTNSEGRLSTGWNLTVEFCSNSASKTTSD